MFALFTKPIGVRWLTTLIAASSLLCCLCGYLEPQVRDVDHWALCMVVAWFIGPLWCLFVVILLVAAFYRTALQHRFAFGLGLAVGLATFFTWYYLVSPNHLQSILLMLAMLLTGSYTVYLTYYRYWKNDPKA